MFEKTVLASDHRLESYQLGRRPEKRAQFCQAPFVSLNFSQTGEVTACCYTRKFPLGSYPQNTISQIWNSPQIESLRAQIRKGEFRGGCQRCLDQINGGNYEQALARNFDISTLSGDDAVAAGPQMLEFEISNICNLECIMCNGQFSSLIRKNRERLPPMVNPYDEHFVEQLQPYWKTVEWAKFLGGEPFLNPLYFKIWDQMIAARSKTRVSITTNATIFNSQVAEVLGKLKPHMAFSVDSIRKSTYEKIRKRASFEKVQENLYRFFEACFRNDRYFIITICPMRQNWEELPELFDWALKNMATVIINTVTSPHEYSLRSLGEEGLRKVVEQLSSQRLKTWRDYWKDGPPWIKALSDDNHRRYQEFIDHLNSWADELALPGAEPKWLALL